ncbi:hypothetical protein VTH82DRAFT_3991 [Thermothelomyces myriococcoides]
MTVGDIDRLSPREAHELLESMIRCDQKRAIQRFHAFHLFYDPKFETVDTTSATVIPGELAYVDVWDRFIPETIVRHLRRADLLWYIDNKKPSAFWAGARLDDEDWRRENGMAKGLGCCPQVHYDVSKLMRVQKIVFDNNLIPKNTFMDL